MAQNKMLNGDSFPTHMLTLSHLCLTHSHCDLSLLYEGQQSPWIQNSVSVFVMMQYMNTQ